MGCIATHTARLGEKLAVSASRQGGNLRVGASLVCTVNLEAPYLRVEPEYIWLTESNQFTAIVQVESNRAWTVE